MASISPVRLREVLGLRLGDDALLARSDPRAPAARLPVAGAHALHGEVVGQADDALPVGQEGVVALLLRGELRRQRGLFRVVRIHFVELLLADLEIALEPSPR